MNSEECHPSSKRKKKISSSCVYVLHTKSHQEVSGRSRAVDVKGNETPKLPCVAGVRKGRGRELGRESERSRARPNSPFPSLPFLRLTPATQTTPKCDVYVQSCCFALKTSYFSMELSTLSLPSLWSLGSLSNYDGDGNENGTKATSLDQQNNNFAPASLFFVHFSAVAARLRR